MADKAGDIDSVGQSALEHGAQARLLAGINRIFETVVTSESGEQFGAVCLEVAEELTGSPVSFIGEVGADGLLHAIAVSSMDWDVCAMRDGQGRPFGRVLADGETLLTNDPAPHPDSIGLPDGHLALSSFLGVPLGDGEEVIGMIAVANRESGYGAAQQAALEALAPTMAQALIRRKAEEELRRNREDLNHAQAVGKIGSWRLNVQENELTWSDEAYRISGLPRGTPLTYETFLGIVHPDDRGYVDRKWKAALQGEPYDIEHRIVVRGQVRWVRERAELEFAPDGRLLGGFGTCQDITPRKQAEAALRESEARYRQLFEAMTEGFLLVEMILDDAGRPASYRYLDANPALEQLSRLKRDEIIGKDVRDVLPGIEDYWIQAFGRVATTGEPETIEQYSRDLGAWYQVYVYRPAPGQAALIYTNITERKETEEALRRSEAIYRRLAEANLVGVGFGDREGNITFVNDEMLRMMGRTRQDYEAGRINWAECVAPEYRAQAEDLGEQLMRNGQVTGYESAFLRPEGGRTPYLGAAALVTPDDDLHVSIALDLTEIRESEEKYRSLFESIDEGFCIIEVIFEGHEPIDYRFLQVNPAFERHTGLVDAEGKRMRELAPKHEEHWFETYGRIAVTGKPERFQNHAEQLGRDYDVFAFRVGRPEDRRVAVLFNDITERKAAEQALEELNESLEQRVAERTAEVHRQAEQLRALASQLSRAEQSERKRLAKVLHDHIQQLIVAARMQVRWLRGGGEPERLQATAQGVDSILGEALQASRSLAVELSPPVLAQAGLVGGLNWLVSRMQDQHQFTVRLRADSSAEPAAEETRFLLFECARELLLNAVKHAGVREAEVALVRSREDEIKLIVEDEGAGFDPDILSARRADETTFGLFSVRERLTHLGGEMEIRSGPGRGTLITLTVPAAGERPHPEEGPGEAPAGEDGDKISVRRRADVCRILIVDDHQMMRQGLVGVFQFEPDIEVVGEAADGPEAIELAQKLAPDIVVMDVNLGEMDGVEATRRILAMDPHISVIGLSMHVDRHVAGAMREVGAVAYLTKDGPAEDLIAAVRACAQE